MQVIDQQNATRTSEVANLLVEKLKTLSNSEDIFLGDIALDLVGKAADICKKLDSIKYALEYKIKTR